MDQNPNINSMPAPDSQQNSQAWLDRFEKPQPEETVLQWVAANRPYKQRNRQYYVTIGTIVLLVSLILFFAGQFLPIAVVVSVGFLAYVLSAIPPSNSTFKLTSYGLRVDESLYNWEDMGRFWFDDKSGQKMLNVEVSRFPFRLSLLLGQQDEQPIRAIMQQILLEEKPKPTQFDKASMWLQQKFPLDL